MLKLTKVDIDDRSVSIYISARHISSISRGAYYTSLRTTIESYIVRETPEEIMAMSEITAGVA